MSQENDLAQTIEAAESAAQKFLHEQGISFRDEVEIQSTLSSLGRIEQKDVARIEALKQKQTRAMLALARELIRTKQSDLIEFWPLSTDTKNSNYSYRTIGSHGPFGGKFDGISPEEFLSRFGDSTEEPEILTQAPNVAKTGESAFGKIDDSLLPQAPKAPTSKSAPFGAIEL